jgi:hypothetical protein
VTPKSVFVTAVVLPLGQKHYIVPGEDPLQLDEFGNLEPAKRTAGHRIVHLVETEIPVKDDRHLALLRADKRLVVKDSPSKKATSEEKAAAKQAAADAKAEEKADAKDAAEDKAAADALVLDPTKEQKKGKK